MATGPISIFAVKPLAYAAIIFIVTTSLKFSFDWIHATKCMRWWSVFLYAEKINLWKQKISYSIILHRFLENKTFVCDTKKERVIF